MSDFAVATRIQGGQRATGFGRKCEAYNGKTAGWQVLSDFPDKTLPPWNRRLRGELYADLRVGWVFRAGISMIREPGGVGKESM